MSRILSVLRWFIFFVVFWNIFRIISNDILKTNYKMMGLSGYRLVALIIAFIVWIIMEFLNYEKKCKEVELPEFAIIFNEFSERECQELFDKIINMGVSFEYGLLHGKAGTGHETSPIGILIKLKSKKDDEKVTAFLSGLKTINWNKVLEDEKKKRRVVGGEP